MIKELCHDEAILSQRCEVATVEDESVAQDLIDGEIKAFALTERQGIVRSIDVAEYLGVTKASVSKAMATLESNGYVEMGKRDVHLTERGLEVARQMWERHCFFVGLLEDAGVSAEVASQEGCHMEHCLSEESFEKLSAMLNRGEATGQAAES